MDRMESSRDGRRRLCLRCLLRDLAEEDQKELKKYLSMIKPKDRAKPEEYERRLALCRVCPKLSQATCLSCGCYVEFRAYGKEGHCPDKKW